MRTRALFVLFASGAIGLAACGGDNSSTSSTAAPAAAATTAAAAATTAPAPATTVDADAGGYGAPVATTAAGAAASGATTVTVDDSPLGKILADAKGNTLYIFTKDTTPGTSVCVDACAKAWPPATATGTPTTATGVTTTGWSTITRADGTTQLALNGQPLYLFAGDGTPGATNGQGSNQVWWVVGADGTAIKS